MKLTARDAAAWIAKPPADRPGTLIHGEDGMRVALRRQELLANLLGEGAEEEMRLTRLAAGDLRRDKAALADALKARGFFPGQRAVFVDEATGQIGEAVAAALEEWREGDAHLVVTAAQQKPSSALRKAFEKHPRAGCIAIYDDPPDRAEIEAQIAGAGIGEIERDASAELTGLALSLTPGDFRQTLDKIALYKAGDPAPLSVADVAACRPASTEAALDEVLAAAAEGQTARLAPLLSRLEAQGVQPVGLCIGAMRHFRQLHAAACDPGGAAAGVGKLRPPVYGPRRDALQRQASRWGMHRLEEALHVLTETDLSLRSSARAPQMAVMARALIRLSMMGRR